MYTPYPIAEGLGALIDAFIERRSYHNKLSLGSLRGHRHSWHPTSNLTQRHKRRAPDPKRLLQHSPPRIVAVEDVNVCACIRNHLSGQRAARSPLDAYRHGVYPYMDLQGRTAVGIQAQAITRISSAMCSGFEVSRS
jgi:hypothetical protein